VNELVRSVDFWDMSMEFNHYEDYAGPPKALENQMRQEIYYRNAFIYIFQHNGFHTNTIFTKAVSPICISASTPRTPCTVQKSRLVLKAHLTPTSQTNNALQNFPPV